MFLRYNTTIPIQIQTLRRMMLARNRRFADSPLEGNCVDALRGSRAFLAWDCHVGCRFVSGLFARPMAAGLDGLSASRGSHLDFALDAHPVPTDYAIRT